MVQLTKRIAYIVGLPGISGSHPRTGPIGGCNAPGQLSPQYQKPPVLWSGPQGRH